MDANTIRQLQLPLIEFLGKFAHCMNNAAFSHLKTYVSGQLSELERKNVEQIAWNGGTNPRTLQEFLASYPWDHNAMRDQLQQIVAEEHQGQVTLGIIDETSFAKKGDKTPGVQRPYCGALGKQDNCIVTVHLSYACEGFNCLLDEELFLPESWSEDRARCREARIPDDMTHRPKTEIALEQYDRAVKNGVSFDWLTFDEWYGSKPAFLSALSHRHQKYVAEVSRNYMVWPKEPRVTERSYRKNRRGRSRKTPRVVSGNPNAIRVDRCFKTARAFTDQAWTLWHVKATQKGPKIVETKHVVVYPKNECSLPSEPHHLLVVRDVRQKDRLKFFVSNAPVNTPISVLLKVAFSRWRVERCFEDDKKYIGMDHYEGRRYPGLIRHLIISSVALLFLARMRGSLLAEYPELTVSQLYQATSALIQSWRLSPGDADKLLEHTASQISYYQRRNAQARTSHTRTAIKRFASEGIDVAAINQCGWDSS